MIQEGDAFELSHQLLVGRVEIASGGLDGGVERKRVMDGSQQLGYTELGLCSYITHQQ